MWAKPQNLGFSKETVQFLQIRFETVFMFANWSQSELQTWLYIVSRCPQRPHLNRSDLVPPCCAIWWSSIASFVSLARSCFISSLAISCGVMTASRLGDIIPNRTFSRRRGFRASYVIIVIIISSPSPHHNHHHHQQQHYSQRLGTIIASYSHTDESFAQSKCRHH